MKLYKKLVITLFTTLITLHASTITPSTQTISAFPNPQNLITIKANIKYLDNDIDIFNDIGSSKRDNFGHIGKLFGADLNFRYGYSKHISFLYNFGINKFDYIDSSLNNTKNELIARVNIYDVPSYIFDLFTIDIGVSRNSGDSVDIKNTNAISKITDISKQNGSYLQLSDMSDNSFFIKAIWGNRFASSILNIFSSIKYTNISTTLNFKPKTDNNIDLGRDEKTLGAGINFVTESENFIYDINYRYLRVFSRGISNTNENHNNIFGLDISYKANRSLLLYFGGNIMLNGYNGVIPYLFNRYSKDSFDRYGFVKIGLVYNFKVDSDLLYRNSY